ncbi:MAG: 2-keto-4-pentenoate hydratase, partial [Streptosporangiaceae bacterium]
MPIADPHAAASILYEARRTGVPVEPFTDSDPSLGMDDGYAVQEHLVRMLLEDGERIAGYKVGLTSKPMQQMVGVSSPDYGPVLASTVYASGAELPLTRFIQPRLEAEIVFVLGERLAGPGVSVADASRATA